MSENPYFMDEPTVISFSGGSTSGFMLWNVLQAHGGKLPDHVLVAFANTGLEHPKTLDFIERCSIEWGVDVNWLEYTGKEGEKFKEVNYATASRNGEPFAKLIKERNYLPNPVTRFCTVELKIRTIDRWANEQKKMADGHIELIGLRYDEPRRVHRIKPNTRKNEAYCPMYDARHTLEDVTKFWKNNSFRLEIEQLYGNCVGCFLKGAGKISRIATEHPEFLQWWSNAEKTLVQTDKPQNARFRLDRPSYAGLLEMAKSQNTFDFEDNDTLPCHCTD